MTTYAERKQRIYERLEPFQQAIAQADANSLDWEWWSRVLELVEQLPRNEQQDWKTKHIPTLRYAIRLPERTRP